MAAMRRLVAHVASGWLVAHLVLVSAVPAVLYAGLPEPVSQEECLCSHDTAAMCPMHHRAPVRDEDDCQCRSTTDHSAAMLNSLLDTTAVLAATDGGDHLTTRPSRPAISEGRPLDPFPVLDAPPPRA
jgi:hypothetical protein